MGCVQRKQPHINFYRFQQREKRVNGAASLIQLTITKLGLHTVLGATLHVSGFMQYRSNDAHQRQDWDSEAAWPKAALFHFHHASNIWRKHTQVPLV